MGVGFPAGRRIGADNRNTARPGTRPERRTDSGRKAVRPDSRAAAECRTAIIPKAVRLAPEPSTFFRFDMQRSRAVQSEAKRRRAAEYPKTETGKEKPKPATCSLPDLYKTERSALGKPGS